MPASLETTATAATRAKGVLKALFTTSPKERSEVVLEADGSIAVTPLPDAPEEAAERAADDRDAD